MRDFRRDWPNAWRTGSSALFTSGPRNLDERPKRICLMRLSALGDVCLMVPVVRTFQKSFPNAQLTWVIGHNALALVEGLEGIEFVTIQKQRPIGNLFTFYRAMRGRSFDALLAAQASFRAHLLLPAIRAPIRVGFDSIRGKDFHSLFVNRRIPFAEQHLLDSFLSFAAAIGAKERVLEWRLPITDADHGFARAHLPGDDTFWLAVNAAASKPERNWFPERYGSVMNHAMEQWNWRVVLTGGSNPNERSLSNQILAAIRKRDGVVDLIGKTTPKQMAAVLGRARLLLAPDTGPVHIATAMGTPVLGMYAVAPSKLSGPYFSRELVIDKFNEAVQKVLGKSPATVKWGTRVHTQKAMELISVEAVLAKLSSFRAREHLGTL
jgi:heptosyltransferase I